MILEIKTLRIPFRFSALSDSRFFMRRLTFQTTRRHVVQNKILRTNIKDNNRKTGYYSRREINIH